MKTLTKENVSIYLFDDSKILTITADNIIVGNPAEFIIDDCDSGSTVLHESVAAPDDWVGHKYNFDGTAWTQNPDWVDPVPAVDEAV